MDSGEVLKSVKLVAVYMTTLLNRESDGVVEPLPPSVFNPALRDTQEWDDYWSGKTEVGTALYDLVATFYRKFIIRPTLNYFVEKHFRRGQEVLHAGCGGGQVDVDIRDYIHITGMDISPRALAFYRRTNGEHCRVLHGSVFSIPLAADSIDGIYNLGVMEHFTEAEIERILGEFRRVLKPGGKVLLFWPPEFGLSVLFFKGLTLFFKNVLGRRNVKFHPDEITRLRSREHARSLIERSNLAVVDYYFGIRDAFTYSIVTAEKR
jgi:SAM-dependent methyltransferase